MPPLPTLDVVFISLFHVSVGMLTMVVYDNRQRTGWGKFREVTADLRFDVKNTRRLPENRTRVNVTVVKNQ